LISPNNIEFKSFANDFQNIVALKILKVFQLRVKTASDETLINLINFIFPLCKKNNIKFIINDRPDIAKIFDLDGVHVGKEDPGIGYCRKLLGKNKIVGISCYSSNFLANNAQIFGASYIAFGSFFKTKTKEKTNKVFRPNIIAWNKVKKIPSVAIGGINYRNFFRLRNLGLDYVAVSSTIWKSKLRPDLSLKKIKNLIDNF
tara:strand:+ start:103 stop:708 length:606 start_codon:yes stop_codon:yes gene_type:complete